MRQLKITSFQRGDYSFETMQCRSCGKYKRLDSFRNYYQSKCSICKKCEKKKRDKTKRKKIAFRKKHGVPLKIYEDAEWNASIKSRDRAENFIFSKISPEERRKFNFSKKMESIVDGITGISSLGIFITVVFLSELLLNKLLLGSIGLLITILIIINKIQKSYKHSHWLPVDKKISTKKKNLYPQIFKQILKALREEFQKNENFYSSLAWRDLRKRFLKNKDRICSLCNKNIFDSDDLTVDHKKPKSKWPELALDPSNLQIACRRCNSSKGNR